MKKIALLFLVSLLIIKAQAQIGIGINPPNPSAILHVQDTAKGLLISRMTALQKNAINNPAEGLLVYQTDNDKGFWYFTNGLWKNMTALNDGGKHTIYLADDITDMEAAAQIAAEAGPNTQVVRIINCSKLTTVDLSMLTSLTEVYLSSDTLLQSIDFSNLQSVSGGFYIDKCPLLASMQLSQIKKFGLNVEGTYALWIKYTRISSLSFPLLTKITGSVRIDNNTTLTSVIAPQLTEQVLPRGNTDFSIINNPALTTVSFPLLTNVGILGIGSGPNVGNLTSLNLNSLINAFTINIAGTLLISISLPALTTIKYSMALSTNTQVNTISFPLLTTIGTRFEINQHSSLTAINLPQLTRIGSETGNDGKVSIATNTILSSFALPNLQTAGYLNITDNSSLLSLSFPSLTNLNNHSNSTTITGNTNLTSISIAGLQSLAYFGLISFAGNKLPSTQINSLLNKFVSINPPLAGRTFNFKQSIPAPPTGQGISDKATLIARSNIVNTD